LRNAKNTVNRGVKFAGPFESIIVPPASSSNLLKSIEFSGKLDTSLLESVVRALPYAGETPVAVISSRSGHYQKVAGPHSALPHLAQQTLSARTISRAAGSSPQIQFSLKLVY